MEKKRLPRLMRNLVRGCLGKGRTVNPEKINRNNDVVRGCGGKNNDGNNKYLCF